MSGEKWLELTRKDFEKLNKEETLVILPIGATEQHGPHLPVGVDTFCVEAMIKGLFEELKDVDFIVMPTIWCSKSNEHLDYPGTIFLSRDTLSGVVEDISASISRAGFKKFVIINWHGGNIDLLSCLIRDIRQKHNLHTYAIDGGSLLFAETPKPDWVRDDDYNIHAGRFETSVMLAEYPDLVRNDGLDGLGSDFRHGKIAKDFDGFKYLIPEGGLLKMGWVTKDVTSDGVVGSPAGANAEDGRKFMDHINSVTCDLLREIVRFEFSND